MTPLTIGALRKALAEISTAHDDKPVVVWLPGSRIDLCGVPRVSKMNSSKDHPCLLVVREGSVLS
jgi:hypothetical protein